MYFNEQQKKLIQQIIIITILKLTFVIMCIVYY